MRPLVLRHALGVLPLLLTAALAACGEDEAPPEEGPGQTDPCTVHLAPSADDQTAVQTALIEASPGSVLCFDDGVYRFTDELSLTVPGVTLRGTGDRAVWDFSGQSVGGSGGNGLSVTADDFVIERLTVINTPGDSIRVDAADNVTFRAVTVRWDGPASDENGAYALYPVRCTNVLIEDCDISGASDAGIYVGQSSNIVVRRNKAHQNVAGIEIENSFDAEVYENEATNNTGGILVFNLPGEQITQKDGKRTLVRDNVVDGNNHPNFATPGNIVAAVPVGTGILVMAVDEVEIRDNVIRNNQAYGVGVVSFVTVDILRGGSGTLDDEAYDPYPETVYVHGNEFADNATRAEGQIAAVAPLADIIWDGYVDAAKPDPDAMKLCLGDNGGATFKNFDSPGGFAQPSTDPAPHDCSHDPVPPVTL